MNTLHFPHWPKRRPKEIPIPVTNLALNLATTAQRYPQQPAIVYYDTPLSYARVWREVEALAGYLQTRAGVAARRPGAAVHAEPPQFAIAYYADRARRRGGRAAQPDARRPPSSARTRRTAARRWRSSGRSCSTSCARYAPDPLATVVVAAYGDYVERETRLNLPPAVAAPRAPLSAPFMDWADALGANAVPGPVTSRRRRRVPAALHLGHDRQAEGLRAHPPLGADHRGLGVCMGRQPGRSVHPLGAAEFHVTGMTRDLNAAILRRLDHRRA